MNYSPIIQTIKSWCIKHRMQYPKPRFWMLCLLGVFLVWFYFCLPKPLFNTGYSTVVEDENGIFLSARIAPDYQWRFPQSDSVPQKFKTAICSFEDEYFYSHPGVNPVSTGRALWQNISRGRVVSGGSTLSMQVVRMSRNSQSRTIINKLYEMILAVRLELRYSKEEIMNIYASHAPFGGNVVGLEAASWRYYNRPAFMLSWGETTALAVLPNAPALVFPGKNTSIYLKKRNRLLDKLLKGKIIDETTCELAKSEPLPSKPKPLPQEVQHLLDKLANDGYAGKRIITTLNYKLQKNVTAIASKYVRYYASNYIHNVAVLVLDTKTGEILAYVGNVELKNKSTSQYVDNVVSVRSSGSILKPFLYAAMLNEGELLPYSLVSDIPTRIGGYSPQNFEKTYEGIVPANIALAHSLNVPAVRELQQYSAHKFHHLLKNLGYTGLTQSTEFYGLSIILGGSEVSLFETTSLYASMGRSLQSYLQKGKYAANDYRMASYLPYQDDKELDYLKNSKFNAASLWYTFEVLSTINRPWGEIGWEYFASTHKIAWKTGTSYGHRDAWTVGVTPEYTVGVWVGNSSGEGRPGLTGVTHAAPIMFEVFKRLNKTTWFKQPINDMVSIAVCSNSGYRASEYCPTEQMLVPKQGVKVKICPYHQAVFLDSTETYRVSASCYPVSAIHIKPWFVLPPGQEYFYRIAHPEYQLLPSYLKGCDPPKEHVIDILEPDNNSAIYIPKGIDGDEGMLIFDAIHRDKNATLFWHIDNEYITQTKGIHKIEVTPGVGKHVLVVEDEVGNISKRRFRILEK